MKVVFLKSFLKDIKKIKDKKTKGKIKDLILEIEAAETVNDINNLEKMKGYNIAYRIRMGGYRVGFYKESECVELARFVKRNDIYKVFPK